ncbi:hypothetical protein HK102_012019 [Quaeritorhiza haematococci]|nr:hypothetical protein HK102_012019 [Quaeritorhiza haematococci]
MLGIAPTPPTSVLSNTDKSVLGSAPPSAAPKPALTHAPSIMPRSPHSSPPQATHQIRKSSLLQNAPISAAVLTAFHHMQVSSGGAGVGVNGGSGTVVTAASTTTTTTVGGVGTPRRSPSTSSTSSPPQTTGGIASGGVSGDDVTAVAEVGTASPDMVLFSSPGEGRDTSASIGAASQLPPTSHPPQASMGKEENGPGESSSQGVGGYQQQQPQQDETEARASKAGPSSGTGEPPFSLSSSGRGVPPTRQISSSSMMSLSSSAKGFDALTNWSSNEPSKVDIAVNQVHVGGHVNRIRPTEDIFDSDEPRIKEDIIRVITQYLNDEGYHASKLTLLDEANVKSREREEQAIEIKRMRKAILEGDWPEVDKLCSKPLVKNQKSFLYAVYKQQYLEYIEHHEIQKAFTHLNKRLKPLEHMQTTPNEFKDLCYALTAKSVHDVPSFKNWEGIGPTREKLVEQFQNMIDFEDADREGQ